MKADHDHDHVHVNDHGHVGVQDHKVRLEASSVFPVFDI
jgi:hypothetical protein